MVDLAANASDSRLTEQWGLEDAEGGQHPVPPGGRQPRRRRAGETSVGPVSGEPSEAGGSLVRSKLVPPAVPVSAVFCRALVERLDAAVDKKLTLIVAPPGYGKSVLLAQWASAH